MSAVSKLLIALLILVAISDALYNNGTNPTNKALNYDISGTLTCYNYSKVNKDENYDKTKDMNCEKGVAYCLGMIAKFRWRGQKKGRPTQRSMGFCAQDGNDIRICDELHKQNKLCLIGKEANEAIKSTMQNNPKRKYDMQILAYCCTTGDHSNNFSQLAAAISKSSPTCYLYAWNMGNTTKNNNQNRIGNCPTQYCKSVMYTATKNGEMYHYMNGGCANDYEDTVCGKMGTDGCLYGEDALAPFAHELANLTMEVHAFCCCEGNNCNSRQRLVDNANLSVCYKYNDVFIGEHDSDERMKKNTCPSKVCYSVLVQRTVGAWTRQMVSADCASEKLCKDIGSDVCLYDVDAAHPRLSQKHLKAVQKEDGVKAKIKAICCCKGERCNTVDALLATDNFHKLTTNQCYQYRDTNFHKGSEKTLKMEKCSGDYCLSSYGAVVDGKGTKMWLDANCAEADICNEIVGNTTDSERCLIGDAASYSSYGKTFLAKENKDQMYRTKFEMVCCCKTDKCNSATFLLEKYENATATEAPVITTTSFAMAAVASDILLTVTLLVGVVIYR